MTSTLDLLGNNPQSSNSFLMCEENISDIIVDNFKLHFDALVILYWCECLIQYNVR
jgi:hypothetical protein